MDHATERVIPHSRGKMIALLLASLLFVACGFFLLLHPDLEGLLEAQVAGLASIGFFGVAAVYFLTRAISPSPALVLRHDGFVDNASLVAAGFVPWSEVESVYVGTVHTHGTSQRFLCVVPRNVEWMLGHLHPVKRFVIRQNRRLVGAPVTIPLHGLTISGDELVAEFRARVPDRFREAG